MERSSALLYRDTSQNLEGFRRQLAREAPMFSKWSAEDIAAAIQTHCDLRTQNVVSAHILGMLKQDMSDVFALSLSEIDSILYTAPGTIARGVLSRVGARPTRALVEA
jgi:hypothetical protein